MARAGKAKAQAGGLGAESSPDEAVEAPQAPPATATAGLAAQATMFIRKAASVLEREVAAGIGAAQMLENQFVNVSELRNRSPDELMQRFRKDGHQLFEIVMDMVTLSVHALENVADRAMRITAFSASGESPAAGRGAGVPTLSPAGATPPGEAVTLELALENASDQVREVGGFQITDLVAANGTRIEAANVSFLPVPLSVPAQGKAVIGVSIRIPPGTAPGLYSALMMVQEMEQVRALIAIEVGPATPGATARG